MEEAVPNSSNYQIRESENQTHLVGLRTRNLIDRLLRGRRIVLGLHLEAESVLHLKRLGRPRRERGMTNLELKRWSRDGKRREGDERRWEKI